MKGNRSRLGLEKSTDRPQESIICSNSLSAKWFSLTGKIPGLMSHQPWPLNRAFFFFFLHSSVKMKGRTDLPRLCRLLFPSTTCHALGRVALFEVAIKAFHKRSSGAVMADPDSSWDSGTLFIMQLASCYDLFALISKSLTTPTGIRTLDR